MTKYLYRKTMQSVTLVTAILVFLVSLQAQFRAPQPERKTPRALGVLETYNNGTRRLIPITFFYEKHYYDATFYHATPVPFTLYAETVYEVQQYGKPLGTFTVQSATENASVWHGNGQFKPLPDPALLAKKKVTPVVVEDSSKPMLRRRAGSEGDNPVARPAPAPNTPEVEEDPNRPKLHRREGSSSAPTPDANPQTKAPTAQPEESSGQDPDRPKLHRKDSSTEEKSAGASTPPQAPVGMAAPTQTAQPAVAQLTPNETPDRPILRRGKPIQVQGGRDLPDFKKEEPVSRLVAISDAGPSEAQPLIHLCSEEERNQMEASARELAQAELRRLAAQRGIALPTPDNAPAKAIAKSKPVAQKKVAASAALPPAELKLQDEQFVPYDLNYNNYATVVFSARYTPEAQGSSSTMTQDIHGRAKSWVVTVVARYDEGKLTKLYSAVSDPRELDLYPELRLVDALDPDGYGRAALLFREQKRDGVSWLLGRMTGYELQTIFETPAR